MRRNEKAKRVVKLGNRLLLYYGTLIFLSLVLVASVQIASTYRSRLDQTRDTLNLLAQRQSLYIENFMEGYKQKAEQLSQNPRIVDERISIDERIQFSRSVRNRFGFGTLALSQEDATVLVYDDAKTVVNLGDRQYMKEVIANERTAISTLMADRLTGNLSVTVATPIPKELNPNGKHEFLLVDLDGNIIKNVATEFTYMQSGQAYLIDSLGHIIAHVDPEQMNLEMSIMERATTQPEFRSLAEFIAAASKSEHGSGMYRYQGKEKFAAYRFVEGTDWRVVVTVESDEVLAGVYAGIWANALLALVILGVAMLITYLVGKSISSKTNALSEALDKLGKYQLHFHIPMMEKIKQKKRMDEIEASILDVDLVKERLLDIVTRTSQASEQVNRSVETLQSAVTHTVMSADDISQTIESLANGATSLAGNAEKGAANVTKMSEFLERNNILLKKLNDDAASIVEYKDKGLVQIRELADISSSNENVFREISAIVNETYESSREIQSSTEMIQQIAQQTNLLALNAAIEAARAGEQGKGFAVVADEIRKLAENSTSFTEQISNVVAKLATKVSEVVQTIQNFEHNMLTQRENTVQTQAEFNNIATSIDRMEQVINNINGSVDRILQENESVMSIMKQLSSMSEENAASTEQVTSSIQEQSAQIQQISSQSEELTEISHGLLELVEQFR
ncbi:MAG: methyl-accepting chemotaxis protein [Bacillota bacterium]|nr:methyl-accepting chemotaxis protein [Bacillota bacterium]